VAKAETPADYGRWTYTATAAVDTGAAVRPSTVLRTGIAVTATDGSTSSPQAAPAVKAQPKKRKRCRGYIRSRVNRTTTSSLLRSAPGSFPSPTVPRIAPSFPLPLLPFVKLVPFVVAIKPHEYKPTDADEFELLDLRRWDNCLQATRGVDEVYALAADMGGISFIGYITAPSCATTP